MIGPLRPPSAAARAAAFFAVVGVEAEQALAGDARRDGADIGADPHVARRARREAVLFLVLAGRSRLALLLLGISGRGRACVQRQDARQPATRANVTGAADEIVQGAGPECRNDRRSAERARRWARSLRHPATIAILALGITQIIAWGTTLYALGVLGKPIAADTGWSQSLVFGGLTVGLLVSGARLDPRRPAHRPPRRAARHGGRVAADGGRARAAGAGDDAARLSAGVGLSRPRHAHDALRCGLRRPGAGDALARTPRHLLPDAVRRALPPPCSGRSATPSTPPTAGARRSSSSPPSTSSLPAAALVRPGPAREPEQAEHARTCSRAAVPAGPRSKARARTHRHGCCSARSSRPAPIVLGAMAVHLVPILEARASPPPRRSDRLAQGRGPGGGPHLGSDAGAQVASDRCRPRFGRLHPAVVPRADAGRGQLLDRAGLHLAVRHLQRACHHHARGRAAGAVRRPRATARSWAFSPRPTCVLAAVAPAAFALIVERWGYGAGEATLLGAGLVLVPRHGAAGPLVSPPPGVKGIAVRLARHYIECYGN